MCSTFSLELLLFFTETLGWVIDLWHFNPQLVTWGWILYGTLSEDWTHYCVVIVNQTSFVNQHTVLSCVLAKDTKFAQQQFCEQDVHVRAHTFLPMIFIFIYKYLQANLLHHGVSELTLYCQCWLDWSTTLTNIINSWLIIRSLSNSKTTHFTNSSIILFLNSAISIFWFYTGDSFWLLYKLTTTSSPIL